MSAVQSVAETNARVQSPPDPLRKAAHELEAVFLSQLFKAMRATVPTEEGFLGSSESEEIFSEMLDEMFSQFAARQLKGGIGDALYRQLNRRFNAPEGKAEQ